MAFAEPVAFSTIVITICCILFVTFVGIVFVNKFKG